MGIGLIMSSKVIMKSTAKTSTSKVRLLFIGDIVARPGRRSVEAILPDLKKSEKIDVVIANAENLTGGKGISRESIYEMIEAGVDYFTGGNHLLFRPGWEELLGDESLGILRPANYSENTPGRGLVTFKINGIEFTLINLEGTHGLETTAENPFTTFADLVNSKKIKGVGLLDFHTEYTSEKRAMGFFTDGNLKVFVGTHTHVPTADIQILPKGTMYVTDLGMVGTMNSVLGVKKEIIINRFAKSGTDRFEWDYTGPKVFNSVLVEIDANGDVSKYSRIDRIIP